MRSLLIILSVVGVALARPGFLGLGLGARSLLHAPLAYSSVAAPVAYSNVAAAPVAYSNVAAAPVAYSNIAAAPVAYSTVAAAPLAYSTVAAAPVAHHIAAPLSVSSQYHAQDELGQYSYGYAGGPSAKSEVKTFDGVTRGGYSYVDARGEVQSVNYVADPVNGFRVAATNLPVAPEAIPSEPLVAPVPVEDTPEVAAAKVAHSAAFAEAKAAADAAPDVSVADEPAAQEVAVVPVARADLLPASVLSRNVEGVVSHTYAPALAYGAVSPASFSYSAIAPGVAPAPISYHAAVAPVSRFAYSSVAPSLSYAHHPISYSAAVAPASYSYSAVAPATYSYSAVAPATYSYSAVAPATYSYSAVAPAISHAPISYAVPHTITSQYHAQDELGQYSYGYSGGPSAKSEVRTLDGVTRGGYSYIDAEGKVQSVNYVADDVNGFRVAATNLPVAPVAPAAPLLETIPDTVEVSSLKAEHLVAVEEAKARLHSA